LGVPQIKTTPYQEVKTRYDAATEQITRFQALYPALYAVSREGVSAATAAFAGKASPAQARKELGSAMRKLLHDIEVTQKKVDEGKPDPLDLTPIHAQLYAGMKGPGSAVDWSDTLPKWVAKKLTVDHDFKKVLKELLLDTAAQAAFLLAPLTGGASIFVMLAGLAVTGVKAYKSAEEYENLARASKTSMVPGTELVTLGQVERAKMMMEADQVALALALLAVGAAAVEALGAIKGPPQQIPPGKTLGPTTKPPISAQKQAGHVSGTPQYNNRIKAGKPTSTFDGDMASAEKLVQEAWAKGTPVPGRAGVKDYDFGTRIGTSPTGQPQTKVRVHQDAQGKIHGHPAGTSGGGGD
jgi:hypothetical protein